MIKAELLGTSLDAGFYSDLTVVNAARVSFDKQHDKFDPDKDTKLINYLAKHGHWTPFSHVRETFEFEMSPEEIGDLFSGLHQYDIAASVWNVSMGNLLFRTSLYGWFGILAKGALPLSEEERVAKYLSAKYPACASPLLKDYEESDEFYFIDDFESNPDFIDVTLRETVPIFVARQRFKHMIGFTYNEVSRRYVDSDPEFYTPDVWRSRPENGMKQGSGSKEINTCYIHAETGHGGETDLDCINDVCLDLYKSALDANVAPEQARMVLPQSMLTSYWVTGSLTAFARAYKLRIDAHAQKEIRDLAVQWDELLTERFGELWKDLIK